MSIKIIFVRHEETQKDPNLPASSWGLSKNGFDNAQKLADNDLLLDANIIYTSSEIKTFQTIKPLAEKLNLKITQLSDLDEVRRGDKFLTNEEFEKEKFRQLEDLDYQAFGGETSREALTRFEKAIERIENENSFHGNSAKQIIVVSHGTILNLYFSQIQNDFSNIKKRWLNTKFGAIGILKDGIVIKDITNIQETYSNIERLIESCGLKISNSKDSGISMSFKEIDENTFDEIESSKDIKEDFEKKYYPRLLSLVTKLNEFYKDRKTAYKYQIFLDARFLYSIFLGPNKFLNKRYLGDDSFKKNVYQELQDFDKFLENQ
jgi:broad specificity phosphatase PhoE